MLKKKAIIVDLDGTLCDVKHRLHFLEGVNKNFNLFNEHLDGDELNHWCAEIIRNFQAKNYSVLLVTGRGDAFREKTKFWLDKNKIIYDQLWMRKIFDQREDAFVKQEIYLDEIKDHFDVLFVLEDRVSVVKMWRDLGLVCLQCDWGDF